MFHFYFSMLNFLFSLCGFHFPEFETIKLWSDAFFFPIGIAIQLWTHECNVSDVAVLFGRLVYLFTHNNRHEGLRVGNKHSIANSQFIFYFSSSNYFHEHKQNTHIFCLHHYNININIGPSEINGYRKMRSSHNYFGGFNQHT